MNKFVKMLSVTGLMVLGLSMSATAGGFLTNGLPVAGGTEYPSTLPLTGAETIPADTNLASGLQPQSEAITTAQLATFVIANDTPNSVYTANTATAATTATAASTSGARLVTLDMTGTLTAGAALTTPTAAQLWAAMPNAYAGQTYVLRVVNNSSGAFAWTVTAGTGVTVTGTATVAQATWREYQVTLTSSSVVGLQNIGSGTN